MERVKKDGTPAKRPGRKPKDYGQPIPGFGPHEPEEVPTVKVDGPLRIETEEPEKVIVAAVDGKPETAGYVKRVKRYSVTAIRYPEIGEFYYDQKYNMIDWRTAEGDEVSMSPTGWKLLMQDLPEIFEALGVPDNE